MKSKIVFLEKCKTVLKTCRNKQEFDRELAVYNLNLPVTPKLISSRADLTLELEMIDGETISYQNELDFSCFAYLFSVLHDRTRQSNKVLCHIDTNPKNYLFRKYDSRYFMIDFAESMYSVPEHDLFNFLLFLAAIYEPEKFEISCQRFLTSYGLKHLLDSARKDNFNLWIDIFDRRREMFNKGQTAVDNRQDLNRFLLTTSFYSFL